MTPPTNSEPAAAQLTPGDYLIPGDYRNLDHLLGIPDEPVDVLEVRAGDQVIYRKEDTPKQQAPKTLRLDPKREKLIQRFQGALHQKAVAAARDRVPQIATKPDTTAVSERQRLLRARKHYSNANERHLPRATRRANAKLMKLAPSNVPAR